MHRVKTSEEPLIQLQVPCLSFGGSAGGDGFWGATETSQAARSPSLHNDGTDGKGFCGATVNSKAARSASLHNGTDGDDDGTGGTGFCGAAVTSSAARSASLHTADVDDLLPLFQLCLEHTDVEWRIPPTNSAGLFTESTTQT